MHRIAQNCSKLRAARAARLFSLIQPMNLLLNLWGRRCCSRRDAKDKVGCSNGAETELLRAIKNAFNSKTFFFRKIPKQELTSQNEGFT